MWSPDRRTLLLLPLLSACGFAPAYAPGAPATALRGRVALAAPADRIAFALSARLQDRLGAAQAPVWRLETTISTAVEERGITPDGAVTRYHLVGQVDWRLVALADGAERLAGRTESFTGYSATGSTVATLAAEDAAAERLMVILADQIVTRLLAAAPGLSP
jgi:LPS-assembly lipoprotein